MNNTETMADSQNAIQRAIFKARLLGYRAKVELRVLQQVGLRGIVRSMQRADWEKQLPVQSVEQFPLPAGMRPSPDGSLGQCQGFSSVGGHTLYYAPEAFAASFGELAKRYPADAALKLMKAPGTASERFATSGTGHSQLQRTLLNSHKGLLLVANRLFAEGIGPRIYDLLEFTDGDTVWTAYVVAHAPGSVAPEEGQSVVSRLKDLVSVGHLALIAPEGFGHGDFVAPSFGNNIFRDSAGKPVYVDFQNFSVARYETYLDSLARAAAADTHFGDKSILRGGRYLYQEVPGLGAAGKRGVAQRMLVLDDLAQAAGLSFKGRLVLDFGCNIGMMMAEYLRRGASWCVGWDLPTTVKHTERLLLSIGCTRFSLREGLLSATAPVAAQVPALVRGSLEGCVISYLAVRGHFGWLNDLARIPWKFMLYEGHENDTKKQTQEYLAELNRKVQVSVVAQAVYSDGDSRERYVAILTRI